MKQLDNSQIEVVGNILRDEGLALFKLGCLRQRLLSSPLASLQLDNFLLDKLRSNWHTKIHNTNDRSFRSRKL
ncbi:MAG: hypothetical protein NUV74_00605, partial [Candidatus Brocadiaceae bacterium]|nr:hypothetical protein [Candidatus Brocadiaceae bacterium]